MTNMSYEQNIVQTMRISDVFSKCVRMWAHILNDFIGKQFVCSTLVEFRKKHTFDRGEQCSLNKLVLCIRFFLGFRQFIEQNVQKD